MEQIKSYNTHAREFRLTFLEEALELLASFETSVVSLTVDVYQDDLVNQMFRNMHSLKGSGASVGYQDLASFSHAIEDLLTFHRDQRIALKQESYDIIIESIDLIRVWLNTYVKDPDSTFVPPEVKDLKKRFSERLKQVTLEFPFGKQTAANLEQTTTKKTSSPTKARQTLKVDVEKIDTIMDLCGELVVIKSQLEQHEDIVALRGDTHLESILGLLGNTIRDVYDRSMTMRLVSLKPTITKLERTVKDTANKLQKLVNFVCEGDDLELDRIMVDQLADPLMHLIRNAVDHGLESREKRIQAGKDRMGTITLKAYYEGSYAIIDIADDGSGIDRNRILKKAREKDIITGTTPDTDFSDSDVFNLLFAPGFSTAATISDISGRGVGLDVVRSTVRNLKGDVTITSTLGKGTNFRVSIPLSTALTDGILVKAGGTTAIVPLTHIKSYVAIKPEMLLEDTGKTILNLDGKYLAGLFLSNYLKIPFVKKKNYTAIISYGHDRPFALIVDSIVGQGQVVLKPIDHYTSNDAPISGAAVLGNGTVALVIDTVALSIWHKEASLGTAA